MSKNNFLVQVCHICEAKFSKSYTFKEKMFGFNDTFKYNECSNCGCLQIAEIPDKMDKYYPPYYYSFTQEIPVLKKHSFFKKQFANLKVKKIYKRSPELLKYIKSIKIKPRHRILDVGCGKGQLICELYNRGFVNVEGVDKFLPQEVNHGFGVKVQKCDLSNLQSNSYDLIMMHHVLEHVEEQQKALIDCGNLLKDNGCLLIRIPIIGEAWNIYRENWVQLDAPRHFILHTIKSMGILANDAGFEIKQTIFDSTSFQFLGSELYKRNIPLFSKEHNYEVYPFEKLFSKEQILEFEEKTELLNQNGKADSVAFFLYKKQLTIRC